ncbi:hypothetical protein, partial [Phenylobacterium sp.]|uniref:hypothetical protein n=1 Tax=Phenylobacterium sp. TaxID=1871053 RepID=UPI002F3FA545
RAALQARLGSLGVTMRDASYALTHDGAVIEFSGNVVAVSEAAFEALAGHLRGEAGVAEFELTRISK